MQKNEEINDNENHINEKEDISTKKNITEKQKFSQLPLNRIKAIMKMDPDTNIISKDAVFVTTKATELFLQCLAKETFKYTEMGRRKTVLKRDLDNAVDNVSSLCFLEGSLEQLL